MKEKLAKAFEIEFHYTEVGFKNETDSKRKAEILWYARQPIFIGMVFRKLMEEFLVDKFPIL